MASIMLISHYTMKNYRTHINKKKITFVGSEILKSIVY